MGLATLLGRKPSKTTKEFRETVFLEFAPEIDSEQGIIKGVKIIGVESENRRRYPIKMLAANAPKYEGAKAYVDHPPKAAASLARGFRDWAGNIRNVTPRTDGLYGDLHLRTKADCFESLLEAAEKFPKDFGLSHVADCEAVFRDGIDCIESINEVFSVDIVTDPATTKGLYESRDRTMNRTLQQILEEAPEDNSYRILVAEMMGDAGMMDMDVEGTAEDTSDDWLKSGIMSAIMTKLESATPDVFKKVLKAVGMSDSVTDNVTGAGAATEATSGTATEQTEKPTEAEEDKVKTEEQAQRITKLESRLTENETVQARLVCENLLLKAGLEATDTRIDALVAIGEAKREELLKTWPAEKSSNGSRRPETSPSRFRESADDDFDAESYEKEYEARLTEARKSRGIKVLTE